MDLLFFWREKYHAFSSWRFKNNFPPALFHPADEFGFITRVVGMKKCFGNMGFGNEHVIPSAPVEGFETIFQGNAAAFVHELKNRGHWQPIMDALGQ